MHHAAGVCRLLLQRATCRVLAVMLLGLLVWDKIRRQGGVYHRAICSGQVNTPCVPLPARRKGAPCRILSPNVRQHPGGLPGLFAKVNEALAAGITG